MRKIILFIGLIALLLLSSCVLTQEEYDNDPMVQRGRQFCLQKGQPFEDIWMYGLAVGTAISCGGHTYKIILVNGKYSEIMN